MTPNILKITLATCLALAAPAVMADGKDDHKPKFGGILVQTKAADLEIVAKPELIQIYLKDHDKLMKLDGVKAKVTLLNGTEKSEVELLPAGDKLEAKGAFKVSQGTKGIAAVTLAGKPLTTARFVVR